MTAPHAFDSASHDRHDLAIVAALADRDAGAALTAGERATAQAQVDGCAACAEIERDLTAIAASIRIAAAPSRPRDFRLTAGDAERLRPRGWRRFLTSLGSARDGVSRPLALGLTTLGLVGVLVGTLPGALPTGGAAGSAAPMDVRQELGSDPDAPGALPDVAGASVEPDEPEILGAATDVPRATNEDSAFEGSEGDAQGERSMGPGAAQAPTVDERALRDDPSGLSVIAVIGGTMLILGLGLFALRWTSRRFE